MNGEDQVQDDINEQEQRREFERERMRDRMLKKGMSGIAGKALGASGAARLAGKEGLNKLNKDPNNNKDSPIKVNKEVNSNINNINLISKIKNDIGPLGPSRLVLSKPVIAAVESFAVAGGLELAIWCDMIVSHKEAGFGVFCRRVGVPLIDGGTIKLPKIIGLNRAMDMILTGREIKGDEAYSWGLVNRLVDKSKVIDEALNIAMSLCQLPQDCLRNDRLSVLQNLDLLGIKKDEKNNTEFDYGLKSLNSNQLEIGLNNFVKLGLGRHGKEIKNKTVSKF